MMSKTDSANRHYAKLNPFFHSLSHFVFFIAIIGEVFRSFKKNEVEKACNEKISFKNFPYYVVNFTNKIGITRWKEQKEKNLNSLDNESKGENTKSNFAKETKQIQPKKEYSSELTLKSFCISIIEFLAGGALIYYSTKNIDEKKSDVSIVQLLSFARATIFFQFGFIDFFENVEIDPKTRELIYDKNTEEEVLPYLLKFLRYFVGDEETTTIESNNLIPQEDTHKIQGDKVEDKHE